MIIMKSFFGKDKKTRNATKNILPTLKFGVAKVGQVNNLGKIIYIGIARPRHTSPSAI